MDTIQPGKMACGTDRAPLPRRGYVPTTGFLCGAKDDRPPTPPNQDQDTDIYMLALGLAEAHSYDPSIATDHTPPKWTAFITI